MRRSPNLQTGLWGRQWANAGAWGSSIKKRDNIRARCVSRSNAALFVNIPDEPQTTLTAGNRGVDEENNSANTTLDDLHAEL